MAERDAKGRWKKGHAPNPRGRPKKEHSLTAALTEYYKGKEKSGTPRVKTLIENLHSLVKAGDMAAIKYVFDRIDGLPTARHEIEQSETPELKIVMDQFVETMTQAKNSESSSDQ